MRDWLVNQSQVPVSFQMNPFKYCSRNADKCVEKGSIGGAGFAHPPPYDVHLEVPWDDRERVPLRM